MASKQTPNYRLSRWAGTDRILMEEFNSDNEKIDTALKANADAVAAAAAALENCGNCFITHGTYMGNNQLSKTLTFSKPPVLVIIRELTNSSSPYHMILIRGCTNANGYGSSSSAAVGVAWNGNSVNWQHSGDERAEFNKTDHAYYYAALLMAE